MEQMSTFLQEAEANSARLQAPEQWLAKALTQPYADCNSGSRKLMNSIQTEQALPLIHAEVPFIMTGYEQGYTDRSSSIIKADADYEVLDKIFKFKDNPNHHYYLLMRRIQDNTLHVFERCEYLYTTETYGYAYNQSMMDNLDIGYEVSEKYILRKSEAYDEYMNPKNSVNLLATYVATDVTLEDSIWISESAQHKLTSYLYKHVTVNVNDNDIMLNLMGDENNYKSFPMIGEKVKDGILCAIRREKIEDSLFTQSVKMLQTILMSDDKYTPGNNGTVIDINIACNNPEILQSKYSNSQILYYYNDHIRFITEFTKSVENIIEKYNMNLKDSLEYRLSEMYYNFKQELAGVQFRSQKVYSGTEIEFIIKEENIPSIGDKLSNRYGGKGVIARIVPDDSMPRIAETGEHLEILINSSTCINRENVGQWHEVSLTHIGKCIVDKIKSSEFLPAEGLKEIIKFVAFCSPYEAMEMEKTINSLEEWEQRMYLESIVDAGNVVLSIKPISESMSLDVLAEIYKAFPYAGQRQILVPMESSNGDIRFIPARRPGVIGHIAMYRLQQYAEEKHSVTALSSTNLRNENSRNKANKYYKATHQATPINFGNMENSDLGHAGFEHVIELLMIHSVSPQARRLVEKLFTDDPYLLDIKLDKNSKNRSAEILNAYLKAIGYKLEFTKTKKKRIKPFMIKPFVIRASSQKKPFIMMDPNLKIADFDKYLDWQKECYEKGRRKPFKYKPFKFE